MSLFFWMLLNLGVPIIGPVFTLALVAPARGWVAAKALIAAPVNDGQLFRCASGLCACADYEVLAAKGVRDGTQPVIVYAFSRIEVLLSLLPTLIAAILFAFLYVYFS